MSPVAHAVAAWRLPLCWLARFGLSAPLVAIVAGVAIPALAEAGRAALLPCVAGLLALTVLLATPGTIRLAELLPAAGLAVSNLLLAPLIAHGLVRGFDLGGASGWIVLVAACPAAGSAAFIAGLLGLPMRPIMLAQLMCFAGLPLTAPLIAQTLLHGHDISAQALFVRIALLVLLPSLLAFVLRQGLGQARVAACAQPLRGAGVLALCGIGLAVAAKLPDLLTAPAMLVGVVAGLAGISLLGALLGALAGVGLGLPMMLALSLGGAVRNVSLLWGAMAGTGAAEGEVVLQVATLWTLLLPALLGVLQWARGTHHGG